MPKQISVIKSATISGKENFNPKTKKSQAKDKTFFKDSIFKKDSAGSNSKLLYKKFKAYMCPFIPKKTDAPSNKKREE